LQSSRCGPVQSVLSAQRRRRREPRKRRRHAASGFATRAAAIAEPLRTEEGDEELHRLRMAYAPCRITRPRLTSTSPMSRGERRVGDGQRYSVMNAVTRASCTARRSRARTLKEASTRRRFAPDGLRPRNCLTGDPNWRGDRNGHRAKRLASKADARTDLYFIFTDKRTSAYASNQAAASNGDSDVRQKSLCELPPQLGRHSNIRRRARQKRGRS